MADATSKSSGEGRGLPHGMILGVTSDGVQVRAGGLSIRYIQLLDRHNCILCPDVFWAQGYNCNYDNNPEEVPGVRAYDYSNFEGGVYTGMKWQVEAAAPAAAAAAAAEITRCASHFSPAPPLRVPVCRVRSSLLDAHAPRTSFPPRALSLHPHTPHPQTPSNSEIQYPKPLLSFMRPKVILPPVAWAAHMFRLTNAFLKTQDGYATRRIHDQCNRTGATRQSSSHTPHRRIVHECANHGVPQRRQPAATGRRPAHLQARTRSRASCLAAYCL
jgi:hypothetical protein